MRFAALVIALGALGACHGKHCVNKKVEQNSNSVRVEWVGCPDDHNHSVECEMRGDEYACNCNPGNTFSPARAKGDTSMSPMSAEQAREGCGWSFTP